MSINNRSPNYTKSPPLPSSENHSYVNLNQSYAAARLPSSSDSNLSSNHNDQFRPMATPRAKSRESLEINAVVDLPFKSSPSMPQNWYSPPSSIRSDSRPPSFVDPKAFNFKVSSKNNTKTSRPTSITSSIQPGTQKRLQTIDEDALVLPLDKLLELCKFDDEDIQSNAFGYLQHITFNNPDRKLEVCDSNGLPIIIENIESVNNYVARAALGVLKNMAYTELEMITTAIANLDAINKLANIIDTTDDVSQKELAIDVLWNLSVKYNLKPIILEKVIQILMDAVIIPDSRMVRQEPGNYVQGEDEIVWSTMLRNALGIIRNVSYENYDARATLREVDGLVDCILYIIFQAGNREIDEDEENQIALIDTKIVENCVCILRNLTYAIQEIIDSEYLVKRRENDINKSKKEVKAKNDTEQNVMIAPPPSSSISKGAELLWNSKYIVTALFPILKNGANAVTLEAAAGVTQNLTAGDWEPSREMQIQFRLQLALPTLIELVDFGTNEVIRSAATALRNLVQENFCRMLVGKNGLKNLTDKIPLSSMSKKIDPTALAALLSTIYVIICDEVEFMKDFVINKGAKRCIYVKDSDEFLCNDDNFPDKVRIFSHCLLELLWKKSETQELLKKSNIKQSDINIPVGKVSGGQSSPDDAETIRRKHESIASGGYNIGPQFPRDERYKRDSMADIVSNNGLRDRNSRAYTTSSIPGYGEIRLPVSGIRASNPNGHLETIRSASQASSIGSIYNGRKTSEYSNRINMNVTANASNHTSRIVSPIPMKPLHGKISVNNRRPSNTSSNHHPSSGGSNKPSRPLPAARPSMQRASHSSNSSEMYNYEYSKPIKPKPISSNVATKRISNSGV